MTEQPTFESALLEVQGILGSKHSELVPSNQKITSIKKDDFQSDDFRRAGLILEQGRENESDRHIITISFAGGEQLFIMTGKVRGNGPYELTYGGADLRKTKTVTYSYDGVGTIVELDLKSGESVTHTGKAGSTDMLVPALHKVNGRLVKTETFTP